MSPSPTTFLPVARFVCVNGCHLSDGISLDGLGCGLFVMIPFTTTGSVAIYADLVGFDPRDPSVKILNMFLQSGHMASLF